MVLKFSLDTRLLRISTIIIQKTVSINIVYILDINSSNFNHLLNLFIK